MIGTRAFFIAILLAVSLFASSALSCSEAQRLTASMDREITLSCSAAEAGSWAEAEAALRSARQIWQTHTLYFYTTADHDALDQTQFLFSSARELLRQKNAGQYQLTALQLSCVLQELKDDQLPTLENIF